VIHKTIPLKNFEIRFVDPASIGSSEHFHGPFENQERKIAINDGNPFVDGWLGAAGMPTVPQPEEKNTA
jgi:hypothetical protein